MVSFTKRVRQTIFVNSWHMNKYESAAMWKLYLQSDDGVAIQSSFKCLTECFSDYDDDVHIGKVNYIDYDSEWIPGGNFLYPFLHKRMSFDHEHELRAIILMSPDRETTQGQAGEMIEGGLYVPVNLDILVEKIFVSPTAPDWFGGLVTAVAEKYNLNKIVIRSHLTQRPLF